jgi:hypothetical protein
MPNLNCPGYNRAVAGGTAWDFASEATVQASKDKAQTKADAKALAAALAGFVEHQCPPPCMSIPIPRLVKRGVTPLATPKEADFTLALAYADWELDVLCVEVPGGSGHGGTGGDGGGHGWPFPHHDSGPPELKPGDVIDGKWLVVDSKCETNIETDPRTVGYTLQTITCSGCGGECRVVRCPTDPFNEADNHWSLVPDSVGGKKIKTFDGQRRYHYKCVCLTE